MSVGHAISLIEEHMKKQKDLLLCFPLRIHLERFPYNDGIGAFLHHPVAQFERDVARIGTTDLVGTMTPIQIRQCSPEDPLDCLALLPHSHCNYRNPFYL